MNAALTTSAIGHCRANSKTIYSFQWRSILTAILLLVGFAANATNFTFNNTGCQTVKVYKVFLLFETHHADVHANQSWTAWSPWGDKWVFRSLSGNYLGEYTIPLFVSNPTHNFNSAGGPSAPIVGNVVHPSCSALGSLTLSGLPAGNWTITRNPGGVTTTGTGSSTTISGLEAGTYSFSVSKAGCTASAAVNAVLNAPPLASSAPALYSFTASNVCPATTVNLNALVPIFVPSGFSVTWHTGTPATASNLVSNPGSVAAGTYYATFFNTANNCYAGTKTTKVTAAIGSCNDLVRNKNRTLDGSMNNLSSSVAANYGKSGNAFARDLPSAYADGINTLAGPNRPNPRALSNRLSQEIEDDHNDRGMSGLFYIWGQFIDHDMTDNRTDATQPANISLPSDESIFTNPIAFNRSRVHPGTGTNNTPREQTNLNTAWIDASQVYGWTPSHAAWLRSFSRGKLKTSKGDLLPFNTLTGEFDSPIDPSAPRMDDDQGGTKKTFVAGDRRVAEHPGLTSLHTTFLREHNRICDELVAQGMTNDEEIYQRARKIIGAMIQHISYSQWMESMGIQLSTYTGYKPSVQPDILNTFSAAAYRWHTMVENDIILRDNECNGVGQVQLPLRDIFFNIEIVRTYDIGVILKGLSVHRQYETDLKVAGGLRNFLAGNFGSDLVSINIQRGRDHGLPSYNDVREHYTGTRAHTFMDIAGVDSTAQKLASIYSSPNDVDLWVGLYAEPRMAGKSIGRTVHALIASQFEKLRDGDYYFYRNDPELSGYLNTILSTNLDDIISRNSGAGNFQDNVFFRKFCTPEGDDLAKTPCNVVPEFAGWTYIGNSSHSKYYRWNGGPMNFADAKEHVEEFLVGNLPQINDLTENNQLQGYLGGQEIYLNMVRTGTGSGSTSWRRSPVFNNDDILVQGQSVSYFRWRTGEPNNVGGVENRVQFKSDGRWNDIAGTPLLPVIAELTCDNVNAPCLAGNSAPALTTFTRANHCPSNTVDLSTVVAANKPLNTILTWHTGAVPTNNNRIANVSAMGAGTYFAAFYSASSNCYSPKTMAYKVTINVCDPCATNNFTIDCEKNINHAGWEIVADCNVSVCPGEKVMLSVNPNGYPTTWTGPNGFTASTNDILVANTAALANAGNYVATVNVNGCIKTKTITLVVRDTDGDGICNENDCQPTNPAFPATPGTACNDGNANTTNDVITADGCGCAGTVPNPCANLGGDTDGDGVCNNNDCQPNNPAFPATPGTACNDGNPNTNNDVITADGCGCAGNAVVLPSIVINNVTVNENAGVAILNVQLSAASNAIVTVQYATAPGTAIAGTDFNAANGTVTFLAGTTTSNISIAIVDDNVNEPTELFTVNLTNPSGATIADNQGVVTILDNDAANPCANLGGDTDGDGVCNNNDCQPNNPAFPATPGTACNDGNPNTTNDVVTANGCGCAGTPANNNPDCANIVITGTATGITVTGLNGAPISSLQIFTTTWQQAFNCFANCGASQTVNLPAGSYLVYAKYYTAGYALICEKQATVTVGGNAQPSLVINNVTVNENAGTATLAVTLSAASTTPVTVQFSTANGSSISASDYTATNGTLTIPAGSTSGNIVVPILDDNLSEPTETFNVNLANATGATIADNQGVVTINDNDQAIPVCDNYTNGGTIGFGTGCLASTQHCPTNGAAPAITNCAAPSGGTGTLEVMWLRSTTSCSTPTTTAAQIAAGQDPHWSVIQGATGLTLDPGSVSANTCYLRCVRRAGCDVFLESNIISLTISNNCGGGNNNGTPNCANITITPGNGNITVGGLGGAPIVSVQVFSATWQQLHNCFANCGSSTATYPVPAGAYYVYVKYYTAGYQLVCEQNQTVNVSVSLASNSSNDFKFDVNKQLEHTELIWLHNGDYLVDEYIVERSVDGSNFEEISFQVSEKDATADVYNDYDLEPVTGDNYYRIKLLNADGTTSYSEVKLVRFEAVEDFSIFPNPANSFANLNLEQYIGKQVDIHIFDNKGVRMKTIQVDEVYGKYFQMDLRDLHEGHYIVWVNTPGKRPVAKKLVIGRV